MRPCGHRHADRLDLAANVEDDPGNCVHARGFHEKVAYRRVIVMFVGHHVVGDVQQGHCRNRMVRRCLCCCCEKVDNDGHSLLNHRGGCVAAVLVMVQHV